MAFFDTLSLQKTLAEGLIEDFISQEEFRSVGPIDRAVFDSISAAVIKAPESADQTLHSVSGDCSTGNKTREDNGPYASR